MNDLTKLSIQSTSLGPQYFICVAVSELPLSFPCKLLTQKKLKWDLQRHSLKIRFLKYIPPTDLTKSDTMSRSCFWEEVEAKIEGEFVIDREQLTHVLTPSYKLPNILISCSSMWTTPASLSAAPPLFGWSWGKPATSHASWVNHREAAHDPGQHLAVGVVPVW